MANKIRTNLWFFGILLLVIGGFWMYAILELVDSYNALADPANATPGEVRAEVANIIKQTVAGGVLSAIVSVIGGITFRLADEKPDSPTVPADVHLALIATLSDERDPAHRDRMNRLKAAVEELESDA